MTNEEILEAANSIMKMTLTMYAQHLRNIAYHNPTPDDLMKIVHAMEQAQQEN
jgi:hypothetical protein